MEKLGAEYNDGFNGRFKPSFSLSNFKKSRFKRSLHFDNTAEIPVFNLLKLHGSLSWATEGDQIIFSPLLHQVNQIDGLTLSSAGSITVQDDSTLNSLVTAASGKTADVSVSEFLTEYDKLLIVNPTKAKFRLPLLEEILTTSCCGWGIFDNELEKRKTRYCM